MGTALMRASPSRISNRFQIDSFGHKGSPGKVLQETGVDVEQLELLQAKLKREIFDRCNAVKLANTASVS